MITDDVIGSLDKIFFMIGVQGWKRKKKKKRKSRPLVNEKRRDDPFQFHLDDVMMTPLG